MVACLIIVSLQVLSFENLTLILSSGTMDWTLDLDQDLDLDMGADLELDNIFRGWAKTQYY